MQYIAEVTKSAQKRFPSEHVGIITDLDIILNASRYPGANSALKNYGLKALERVCDHYRSERSSCATGAEGAHAAGFHPNDESARRIGKSDIQTVLPTSDHFLGKKFPSFKTFS